MGPTSPSGFPCPELQPTGTWVLVAVGPLLHPDHSAPTTAGTGSYLCSEDSRYSATFADLLPLPDGVKREKSGQKREKSRKHLSLQPSKRKGGCWETMGRKFFKSFKQFLSGITGNTPILQGVSTGSNRKGPWSWMGRWGKEDNYTPDCENSMKLSTEICQPRNIATHWQCQSPATYNHNYLWLNPTSNSSSTICTLRKKKTKKNHLDAVLNSLP